MVKVRCLSCRKLKIGCDEGRPKCEYCLATNKDCIYPTPNLKRRRRAKRKILDTLESPKNNAEQFESEEEVKNDSADVGMGHKLLSLRGSVNNVHQVDRSQETIDAVDSLIAKISFSERSQEEEGSITEIEEVNQRSFMNPGQMIYQQGELNRDYKQMRITKFEYRLLTTFNTGYVGRGIFNSFNHDQLNPMERIWIMETPRLFHESSIIRQNIYSLATMLLNESVDLNQTIKSDMEYTSLSAGDSSPEGTIFNSSPVKGQVVELDPFSSKDIISQRDEMIQSTIEYFKSCLNETNELVSNLLSGNVEMTAEKAAEAVMSSILLFSFLTMQPYNLIPLISFNNHDADLVKMIRQMKTASMSFLPLVYNSRFHGLLYFTEFFGHPVIAQEYPIIKELSDSYNSNYRQAYDNHTAACLDRSLQLLHTCMFKCVVNNDPAHIFRWIFANDVEVLDLMESKDYFCLKILYYYCCLSVFGGIVYNRYKSIFIDFIIWFKEFCFGLFNDWESKFDSDLYTLFFQEFSLQFDLQTLQSFVPGDYVRKE